MFSILILTFWFDVTPPVQPFVNPGTAFLSPVTGSPQMPPPDDSPKPTPPSKFITERSQNRSQDTPKSRNKKRRKKRKKERLRGSR